MKHNVRVLITVLIVLAMLFSLSIPGYAGTKNTIRISIGGQTLDTGAIESEGTIFLPLRSVCETLGYTVEWSKENRSVTVKDNDKTVLFEPKADTVTDAGHSYYVNGRYLGDNYIGGGCKLVNNRIYAASDIMESCFGIKETFDQTANSYVLSISPQGNITAENRKIYSEDSKLLTNIQYPYISTADKAVADKINAAILADVEKAQKEAQDNLKAYGSYQSPNKFETYFNYKIAYMQGNLLSLVLYDYQYYGGAHGIEIQISHTFDLKTGREYSLADLMDSNSEYAKYINDSIKADIVKDNLEDAQITKFVSIADNQNYYLSNKGLVIYFQEYEYFPYAAGIMEYNFPYADLSDYLKPEVQL